jgi:preprotein translocase subunit SecD
VTGRARVLVILLLVVLFGIGGSMVMMSASEKSEPTPEPSPTGSAPTPPAGSGNALELRRVLFQESGQTLQKPALAPGPDSGGPNASARLLRTDCDLAPRPAKPDDLIIACDAPGFRYGLGPSELPSDAVASASAVQTPDGEWAVLVTLTESAADDFAEVTGRLSSARPPLNQLAIVLNGAVVSAPAVNERIAGGELQISGAFAQQEAEALASSLV